MAGEKGKRDNKSEKHRFSQKKFENYLHEYKNYNEEIDEELI